ncbi:MAG: 2-oxoisovalerate dehydrogenase subunit beta [Opitutia bacterium UBA7350]|nr:MAG: 2-oxoisovalerate dehydrogenase subunit beta [Opitutae bacterium UBA7350]
MSKNLKSASLTDGADPRLDLMCALWRSRLGDLREQSLIRQGKGWFHISGMGHEALAAAALHLEAGDYTFPYYRDRAFCVQRGLSDSSLALAFYAKRDSSSGGRQLTGHFSDRNLNIWSHPSPVGAHLLPACGAAWGIQIDGNKQVVYASLGEAASRQGDFYEAVCFAKERQLPIVFVVEDNRIAISTDTQHTNPLALGVLSESEWRRVDGVDVDAVDAVMKEAVDDARSGKGPAFVWCDVERFSNHSSADDQRMYRDSDEMEALQSRDPVARYQAQLIASRLMTQAEAEVLEEKIKSEVRAAYKAAESAEDPRAEEQAKHLYGPAGKVEEAPIELDSECRILDAVNRTFHAALENMPEVVFFGEDIADPKGGVFNLTKGLSSKDSVRAVNSPLAESTIMGVAVGLASYGKRPCFEIQFVDFIYPGWNQLVSNMATLRWRSFGQWQCPLVIYAPCGGYLPGGALWHSQSGEANFARIPGLRVAVPSTPNDAAGLFWSALKGSDPTIILLPKHLMWAAQAAPAPLPLVELGKARIIREGDVLTMVTWGNCVELAEESLEGMDSDLSVELIDLRSIAPWDRAAVMESVCKTGRLLVLQEDNISASIGQMLVAELCSERRVLEALKSPPAIVSKGDVHIGFNPIYEYDALPDGERVVAAIDELLGSALKSSLEAVSYNNDDPVADAGTPSTETEANLTMNSGNPIKTITVPILGEGIRVARIVAVHKTSGEAVAADEALCEVETDKAVFPIECDVDGRVLEWKVALDDEVKVGQELLELEVTDSSDGVSPRVTSDAAEAAPVSTGLSPEAILQLQGIVPATIDMTCRWDAVSAARLRSKELGGGTISPVTMSAWVAVQSMKSNSRFASYVSGGKLQEVDEDFDLGIAVALPGDILETAVVSGADKLSWEAFPEAVNLAMKKVRQGEAVSKSRVSLIISSLGTYSVRSAIPVVVPPAVATLFVGAPHHLPDPKSEKGGFMEAVSLVLTFDHRWINGVGAAAFLSKVRKGVEQFDLV